MDLTIKFMDQTSIILNNIDETFTIIEVKNKIKEKFPNEEEKYDVSKLKLVHNGKVLENEKTLDLYNVIDKPLVYCIISKEKPKKADSENKIIKNTETEKELETEKIEKNETNNPNPQSIDNPFAGNPLFGNINQSAIGMENLSGMVNMHRNMMNNPQVMNISMRMMSDPEIAPLMSQMLTNPNIMSDPNFIMNMMTNPRYMEYMNEYMQIMGETSGNSQVPSDLLGMPIDPTELQSRTQNPTQPQQQTQNLEDLYKTQLEELTSFGFYDKDLNIQCLRRANGDLNTALNFLLDVYKN